MNTLTLITAAVEAHERKGTRRYDVYLGDRAIGEVKRYREHYPYKNIGGNVALFRSRWSWRASGVHRSFDTRKEAVAALAENHR